MTLQPKVSHNEFLHIIDSFEAKLALLQESPAKPFPFHTGVTISRGVYVFYLGDSPQYTGKSNRIPVRLGEHSRIGAGFRSAAFAIRVVRRELGIDPTYHLRRSDKRHSSNDPKFKEAFDAAKEKIRSMSVRIIEETDPTRQALLEIYIATRLGCPYNDFDNH